MVAILRIADGTDHVDLLGPAAYRLRSWRPSKAPIKAGGVWQSSPLADGRRLVAYRWDNLIDTFTMDSFGGTQDDLIRITQDAERLLVKALDYWTAAWQTVPVWLEAKADRETNTRYAVVKSYDFANYSGPYEQPFASCPPSFDELILVLEHGPWLANVPGQSETVALCGDMSYYDYTAMSQVGPFAPGAANDDCDVTMPGGVITLGGLVLRFGFGDFSLGCRFINVTVPNSPLVTLAYIDPTEAPAGAGDVVYALVRGELNANPAIFSTFIDFITRARTTAYIPWTHVEPFVPAAGRLFVPDFKNVVQEIVDLAAWNSGQDMVVFIEDNDCVSAGIWRQVRSQEEGRPLDLYVEYVDNPAANTWAFGRAANALGESYVSNHQQPGNLTHVFRYDASEAPPDDYTNLLNGAGGYDLFPNPLTAGDMIYFGVADNAVYDNVPRSLVFDISPAIIENDCQIRWEKGDNGAWNPLIHHRDNTNEFWGLLQERPFTQSGVCSIHWKAYLNDLSATVNGVVGEWVRANIIAAPTGGPPPRQVNRDVYTVNWPNVRIAAAQIAGDIPASVNIRYHNQSAYKGLANHDVEHDFNHLMISARSTSRGDGFTPFINFSDQDQPIGISIMPGTASLLTTVDTCNYFINQEVAICPRVLLAPAAANVLLTSAWIQLNAAKAAEYIGTFRVFLRAYIFEAAYLQVKLYGWPNQTGGPGGTLLWESDQCIPAATPWELLPFGKVTIPAPTVEYSALVFEIICSKTAGNEIKFSDLILMPVDEWSGEFSQTPTYGSCGYGQYLEIDSVCNPKIPVTANLRQEDTGELVIPWKTVVNGPATLQANAEQDLWFLAWYEDSDGKWSARPYICGSIEVLKNERYLGMRGAR